MKQAIDAQLDLWLWPLDVDGRRLQGLSQQLSVDETLRADSFVFDRDRRHFISARGHMREILADVLGISPADVQFRYNTNGKPFLDTGPNFNLSHSGGWAALVTSPGPPIGIDIERHRPVEKELAARFFSQVEQRALNTLPAPEWSAGFFRCWTRKEAFLKASGEGLWRALDSFDTTLAPDTAAAITRIDDTTDHPDLWTMVHLDLGPEFTGAIALHAAAKANVVYRERFPPIHTAPGRNQT